MCYIDGQKNKYSVLNECSRMLKYNILLTPYGSPFLAGPPFPRSFPTNRVHLYVYVIFLTMQGVSKRALQQYNTKLREVLFSGSRIAADRQTTSQA
jgi:hypothetical protein